MTLEEYINSNVACGNSLHDKFDVVHLYTNDLAIFSKDTTIKYININGITIYADAPFIIFQYDKHIGITLNITPVDINEYSKFTIILKENTKVIFSAVKDTLVIKIKECDNND